MFAIRFLSVCMYDSNPDILGQYPSTVTTHGDFSQPSTVPPEHQNSFHNQSNTTSISTTYTPYHDEHSPIVRLHLQTVCLPWKLTHPAARTWLLIMLPTTTKFRDISHDILPPPTEYKGNALSKHLSQQQ